MSSVVVDNLKVKIAVPMTVVTRDSGTRDSSTSGMGAHP